MAEKAAGITHARPKAKDDKKDGKKEQAAKMPSDFGSHTSMTDAELNEKIAAPRQEAADPWVILKDERGSYATRKSRLDTGMADPNRFADLPAREQQVKQLTTA
jgi:hypothetical protein